MTATATRERPPTDRAGDTITVRCGRVTCEVTINRYPGGRPCEMFIKADGDWQGWANALAVTCSLALQSGASLHNILRHWRFMAFEPCGVRERSIPDAIARAVMRDTEHAP